MRNEFSGVLTGKGLGWGGSHIRSEATGYGVGYFAAEILKANNQSMADKTCLICEGADMPTVPNAIDLFGDSGIWYAPGTAANKGGVAASCLEMAQNKMSLAWPADEVDCRLRAIMKNIHETCLDTAAEFGRSGNYLMDPNITSFTRVVHTFQDQGLF